MLQKQVFNFIKGQGDYHLLPVEFFKEQIPFEVKRTYFVVADETETQTGQHAHYEEEEVFLIVKGSAVLISIDENGEDVEIELKAGEAVYIPKMMWHGFRQIASESVIAAFSSTHHEADRSDYLEDREEYVGKIDTMQAVISCDSEKRQKGLQKVSSATELFNALDEKS